MDLIPKEHGSSHRTPAQARPPLYSVDIDRLISRLIDAMKEELKHLEEPNVLLDIHAVARRLRVSKRTVETLIADGEISPLWVRGQRRFTSEAVEAYLRHDARRRGGGVLSQ